MPTPNRGYTYPSTGDAATVPADLQAPLEQIDADVQTLVDTNTAIEQYVHEEIAESRTWVTEQIDAIPEPDFTPYATNESVALRTLQQVSGTVAVPTAGPRVREFYAVGSGVTMGGEFFPADTAFVVRRRVDGASDVAVVGESGSWREFGMPPEVQNDHTPPTAGTLTVSTGPGTATLTVTGAMDDVRLHATPYRFSRNGGGSWSAWRASNVYDFTGLASDTSYTFQHEVRDANGNTTAGAQVVMSTPKIPVWSTVASDNFTAADGTPIDGRVSPVGALTWGAGNGTPTITGGAVIAPTSAASAQLVGSATSKGIRVSHDYTLGTNLQLGGYAGLNAQTTVSFFLRATLSRQGDGTASLAFSEYGVAGWTATITAPTGHPLTGRATMTILPSSGSGEILINGVQVATLTGPTGNTFVGTGFNVGNGGQVDNVQLERSDV